MEVDFYKLHKPIPFYSSLFFLGRQFLQIGLTFIKAGHKSISICKCRKRKDSEKTKIDGQFFDAFGKFD